MLMKLGRANNQIMHCG